MYLAFSKGYRKSAEQDNFLGTIRRYRGGITLLSWTAERVKGSRTVKKNDTSK